MSSRSTTVLHRFFAIIPKPLHAMLSFLIALFSLRNVLLLFCLLNIKNLPLVWELRLIYRSWTAWRTKRDVAGLLEKASSSATNGSKPPGSTHPLFAPVSITTNSPLLEIDHNLHKSNSTYFSDLDESRTKLMVHLLSSTKFSPKELEKEGIKGSFSVILGSVHTSFLKEIKPYESYTVRSRVLGWDQKWILIGSDFVRPKTSKDRKREQKDLARKAKLLGKSEDELKQEQGVDSSEVLLACALSKYVVKKGRFTVPPERSWISAGWLPPRPAGQASPPIALNTSDASTPDNEAAEGEIKITEEDLRRKAQQTAAEAASKLQQVQDGKTHMLAKANEACWKAASNWSWEDIEAERARGMKLAEQWFGLDASLKALWQQENEGL